MLFFLNAFPSSRRRKQQNPCMPKCEILFWTFLQAQKELEGFRTTKMTGIASTFTKTDFYFDNFIFDSDFQRKTLKNRQKSAFEKTTFFIFVFQKSIKNQNLSFLIRESLVNLVKSLQTKNEGNRSNIGMNRSISLSNPGLDSLTLGGGLSK